MYMHVAPHMFKEVISKGNDVILFRDLGINSLTKNIKNLPDRDPWEP